MKKELHILIVEDNISEQGTWARQLEQHNAAASEDDNNFTISHVFARTKVDALTLIRHNEFDAAIVDLGLAMPDGHTETNADGNEVVISLVKSELAVVVIFTGQAPTAIPSDIRGPNVKVIDKGGADGDGTQKVMEYLIDSAPMIFTIRAAGAVIKKEMAAMFSKSIWPRWKFWLADKQRPDDDVTAAVSRHLASHVYAALLEKGSQKVLPEEWYFVPPIRDGLRTGDLIVMDGFNQFNTPCAIIITPRCDLSNHPGNKNETYQLAACEDVSLMYSDRNGRHQQALLAMQNAKDTPNDSKKLFSAVKEAQESLRRLIQHNNNTSTCHFLHQMQMADGTTRGPFLVRFDKIISFHRESQEGKKLAAIKPFASVSPEFLPSMVERLGTYFSRIGTPDLSFAE